MQGLPVPPFLMASLNKKLQLQCQKPLLPVSSEKSCLNLSLPTVAWVYPTTQQRH